MKWVVAAFLLAVSLVSALALAKPWPFTRGAMVAPIHYLSNGDPLLPVRRMWNL